MTHVPRLTLLPFLFTVALLLITSCSRTYEAQVIVELTGEGKDGETPLEAVRGVVKRTKTHERTAKVLSLDEHRVKVEAIPGTNRIRIRTWGPDPDMAQRVATTWGIAVVNTFGLHPLGYTAHIVENTDSRER